MTDCGPELIEGALARLRRGPFPGLAAVEPRVRLAGRAVVDVTTRAGQRAVVKIDTVLARHRCEVAVLRLAAAEGLAVPRVLHAEDAEAPALLVLETVTGVPLDQAGGRAWRGAGALLRRLHELAPPVDVPGFDHAALTREVARRVLAAGLLPEPLLDRLVEPALAALAAAGSTRPRRLCHGDVQPDHVLVDPGGDEVVALLDFGDVSVGDPVWDLVVLGLYLPHALRDVLAGYRADDAVRQRLRVLGPAYQTLRLLSAASWLRDRAMDPTVELTALRELAAGGGRLSVPR